MLLYASVANGAILVRRCMLRRCDRGATVVSVAMVRCDGCDDATGAIVVRRLRVLRRSDGCVEV